MLDSFQFVLHHKFIKYRSIQVMPTCTSSKETDGLMDDLRFYVLFFSNSVISGRCLDDNERLCVTELRLRLRRFHLE